MIGALMRLWDGAILALVDLWANMACRAATELAARDDPLGRRWRQVALPRCGNDKYAWRKIFDHDPRFTTLSDKIACKEWVRERVPELGIASVLWQGDDPAEMPSTLLSGTGIAKTRHGWQDQVIFVNGIPPSETVVQRMRAAQSRNHARSAMQWAYFDVPRQVFVEELLGNGRPIQELKIYTFGKVIERIIHIHDRFGEMAANAYQLEASGKMHLRDAVVADAPLALPLPPCIEQAKQIALRLGSPFDHMRVDLLTDGQRLWLGEMTVYNLAGRIPPRGHETEALCNRLWDLRRSWFLSTPQSGWRGIYAGALKRRLDRVGADIPREITRLYGEDAQ